MIFFRTLKAVLALFVIYNSMPLVLAQVPEEEHLSHHPELSAPAVPEPGNKGPGMSGDKGKGMMGGMKTRMVPQEPEELYPMLMALPEISSRQRSKLKQQAHERLLDGTALMSEGLGQLVNASKRNDLAAMQYATAKLREGITKFETGLATWRAIEEGVPPRNEALQWFKREMNLLSPYIGEQQHGVLGMSWLHFFMMLILTAFFIVMVWMYFFKMRRAAALLEKLAAEVPSKESTESTRTGSDVKAVELEGSDITTVTQKGVTVTFKTSEKSTQLTLDETILDASERVGVKIESSCRVGACGMCSVKLLSGQVTMEVEDGLTPDDKAAGMILACQARPKNDIEVEA